MHSSSNIGGGRHDNGQVGKLINPSLLACGLVANLKCTTTEEEVFAKKMGSSGTRRKSIWLLGFILLGVLIVGIILEFVDANDAENSVESAVRRVLNRRDKASDEVSNSAGSLILEEDKLDEDMLRDEAEDGEDSDEADSILTLSGMRASLVCAFGAIFSLYTLVVEHMKWDPKSFQKFSIATKIPVEVFCVSGPLVLVSSIIYTLMAGLLLTGGGSSSAFFIAASWSAIMIDMSFVCYSNPFWEIISNRIDLILHFVNLVTVYNTYNQLRFFPYTFVICGLSFWGVVIGLRLVRRLRAGDTRPSNIFRPGSP